MSANRAIPGTCQICHCTEDRACVSDGKPCSWVNKARTLCSECACMDPHSEAMLQALLSLLERRVQRWQIQAWPPLTRARIRDWASRAYLQASDGPGPAPLLREPHRLVAACGGKRG